MSLQAKHLSQQNVITSKLSNLSLQLYSIFLRTGYAKNEQEANEISNYFNNRLPDYDFKNLGFREKLWLYKAHLWYSFIIQDFKNCYKYALKWVNLFYENPNMIRLNPVFFLKGNNYLLEALFFIRNTIKFKNVLSKLESTKQENSLPKNENVESLYFLYANLNKLNIHFIEGTFNEGLALISEIESEMELHKNRIDEHHIMIFYYKFASLHFGTGNNEMCISYLDKIISNKSLSMREDLLCFSRVLNLVAHYEAGLDYHLESLLRSTYKFLIKMNDLHEVQKEMISFIRGLQDIFPQDLKKAFKALATKLKIYENHPFERRAFLYLDIISWLESKVENKPVAEIIKAKYIQTL